MTMPEVSSNAYRSPQSFGDSTADDGLSSSGRRSGGLTAICVIAIILGGLGLASSMMGLCAMAAKPWMNNAFIMPEQPGKVDKVRDAQLEMQEKVEEVTDRYIGFNLCFLLLNVLIGSSLLTGGILALKLNPTGSRLLIAAFTTAIVFEILRAVLQTFMQIEMAEVMYDSMSRMMQATPSRSGAVPAEATAVTAVFMKIGVYVGLAFTLAFALAKVIFYAIGTRYLQRPNIRQLFQQPEA